MTVLEFIQSRAAELAQLGVESPRLQVELLLAHVLGSSRLALYIDPQRALTPAEAEKAQELVRRRGRREPLQHILGSTSFCGLELKVGPQVLVPRPETELLAERAWQLLEARGSKASTWVLDFGTGSGCLALAIAARLPWVQICAVDVSAAALAVARGNALQYHKNSQIHFVCGAGVSALSPRRQFQLIVANPPYIPRAEISTLEPEVRDYDPHLALDGGLDGLDLYRELAVTAQALLRPDGRLMMEFGDGQEEKIAELFQAKGWIIEAVQTDYRQRPRLIEVRLASGDKGPDPCHGPRP